MTVSPQGVATLLGTLVALFVGLFAFDAFEGNAPLLHKFGEFGLHLIPAALLLAVILISRGREWVGAFVFFGLALAYGYFARDHLQWVVAMSGSFLAVAFCYGWSWSRRSRR